MRITYDRGIFIHSAGLWLDALLPREISFISHAHFDHMRPHRRILCTPATARLIRTRLPDADKCQFLTPAFGEKITLSGHTITLFPAGHVLGSAMLHITAPDGDSILYTGDFKLRESLTSEQPTPPTARQLIMETTYGLPHYRFPPTDEVIHHILDFCTEALEDQHTPILLCYALGKAQEILAALQQHNLPVALHPQIADLADDYSALGIHFPLYTRLPPTAPNTKKSSTHLPHQAVILMPPNANGSRLMRAFRKRRTAILTGWALDPGAIYRYQVDAAFPLSDHADYPDLLRLVEIVRPEIVHTIHGHATEFSADLRRRGITSWPLAADTQTEFDTLTTTQDALSHLKEPPPAPAPGTLLENPTASTFTHLAQVAENIARTPAKKEKIQLLAELLCSLPTEELPHAVRFLDARPFPRSESLRLQIGAAALRAAACAAIPCTEAQFRAAYSLTRDLARTIASLLAKKHHTLSTPASVTEIAHTLHRLANTTSPTARHDLLRNTLGRLDPSSAALLSGIITGDLRIGLRAGLVEDAIATAYHADPAQVRLAHLITGDLGTTATLAARQSLHTAAPTPLHPLQPMLATPLQDVREALTRLNPPLWCEPKYDGIRCQLHLHRGTAELYTRDLHPITSTFPEIVRAAQKLPHTALILDGELLAFAQGRPLPFAQLQKLLGRTDRHADDLFHSTRIPLAYIIFDVLLADQKSFLHEPLHNRRAWLQTQHWPEPLRLITLHHASDPSELESLFARAIAAGAEGLMLKNPHSPYRPGRRGLDWFKFKKELATLDCVVTAVEYGHGKRKHLLSDYTFAVRDGERLLNIGKAYSGLTDDELETLTTHFLANTLEKKGRLHIVRPDTVIEVAFNGIAPSQRHNSGLALRFPRIKRLRPDKSPAHIDTLATAQALSQR
jgi:DNA ligase-1